MDVLALAASENVLRTCDCCCLHEEGAGNEGGPTRHPGRVGAMLDMLGIEVHDGDFAGAEADALVLQTNHVLLVWTACSTWETQECHSGAFKVHHWLACSFATMNSSCRPSVADDSSSDELDVQL